MIQNTFWKNSIDSPPGELELFQSSSKVCSWSKKLSPTTLPRPLTRLCAKPMLVARLGFLSTCMFVSMPSSRSERVLFVNGSVSTYLGSLTKNK